MVKNSFQDAVLGGGCRIKDESKKCMKGSGERRGFMEGSVSGGAFSPILGSLIVETRVCVWSTLQTFVRLNKIKWQGSISATKKISLERGVDFLPAVRPRLTIWHTPTSKRSYFAICDGCENNLWMAILLPA